MTKKHAEYRQPDKARVLEMYRQGKTLLSIAEDQHCRIVDVYLAIREAWFDGKV